MSDDNELHLKLIDGAMRAIEQQITLSEDDRRSVAADVVVTVLRNLADEIDAAVEDDVEWPDGDDLRIVAGEIEDLDA